MGMKTEALLGKIHECLEEAKTSTRFPREGAVCQQLRSFQSLQEYGPRVYLLLNSCFFFPNPLITREAH